MYLGCRVQGVPDLQGISSRGRRAPGRVAIGSLGEEE